MFKSRNITVDAFIEEFFETLTPGVIPRQHFIDWEQIKSKCLKFADVIEYLQGLTYRNPAELRKELAGTLLSNDEPFHIIKGCFELLGHTNDYYVSDLDSAQFEIASEEIEKGSSKTAEYIAEIIVDLGLSNLVSAKDVQSAFLGVQVGLESNRRKSVGGATFNQWVHELLNSTCALIASNCEIKREIRIPYRDPRIAKKVDFALLVDGKIKIGIEVNFYTTGGSKPSEIKRAYQQVDRELALVGVQLVWITDGAGYLGMKKGLAEAFETHPNTYNFEMAQRYLKDDILSFLAVPS